MPAFRRQLVPIVQACQVGSENYEVFLLQTESESTCYWGKGLCSCNQFHCMLNSIPFSFMVQIYWLSFVAFFRFMFLKLEMCAVNLDLKVLLVKPVYISCLSLSLLVTIAW